MSIFANVYGRVFEKLVARVFEMGTEQGLTVILMTKDREGMVQLLANDERSDRIADIISEAMVRLVQAARDEEEARNATKN